MESSVLPGAGSSNLIFLALREFLHKNSRVLITDPCYGEYIHVLEKIIKCRVDRFDLKKQTDFTLDTGRLLNEMNEGYNMVILVNPNSPTGVYTSKDAMKELLVQIPANTLVWIDETYIDFVGPHESLESFATGRENMIICKSMSKAYALSGVRAAYLCASPHLIEGLKVLSPPWSVSLPAQAAAIAALRDPEYYRSKYEETARLREALKNDLMDSGIERIIDGVANFLLFYLPPGLISADKFIRKCQQDNLFLRDVSNMGKNIGEAAVRMAVKDAATNQKMITVIRKNLTLESSRSSTHLHPHT